MAVIDIFVFAAGFAACWFGKDWLLKKWQGAETYAKNLEAKANAIKGAVATAAKS
jgi:hypothetical protein